MRPKRGVDTQGGQDPPYCLQQMPDIRQDQFSLGCVRLLRLLGACRGFPILGDYLSRVPIHPQISCDMLLFLCLLWDVRADIVSPTEQRAGYCCLMSQWVV